MDSYEKLKNDYTNLEKYKKLFEEDCYKFDRSKVLITAMWDTQYVEEVLSESRNQIIIIPMCVVMSLRWRNEAYGDVTENLKNIILGLNWLNNDCENVIHEFNKAIDSIFNKFDLKNMEYDFCGIKIPMIVFSNDQIKNNRLIFILDKDTDEIQKVIKLV